MKPYGMTLVKQTRTIPVLLLLHFGAAAMPEAEYELCTAFLLYLGICLSTEEKSREKLNQGSREVPSGNN
jgi:hypothetical protein